MKKINKILKYLSVISFKTFSEHEWAIYALFFILWHASIGASNVWLKQRVWLGWILDVSAVIRFYRTCSCWFFKPSFSSLFQALTVMLHGTIRSDDFERNTALQHCCDVVSNSCNIATQCCAESCRCESSRVTSPLDSSSRRLEVMGARKNGAREWDTPRSFLCPLLPSACYVGLDRSVDA